MHVTTSSKATTPTRSGNKSAAREPERLEEVIDRVVGRTVLVADPECLGEAPLGYQIGSNVYSAKLLGRKEDCLVFARKLVHQRGKKKTEEVVKQYVATSRVKGVTLMKSRVVVHL